jgi:hypothetical protein
MTSRLYDGSGAAPAETRLLHAGPLSLEYENGLIRNVRLGEQEIVRAVYAAVRDHNWGTVPGDLRDLTLDARENQFDLRFTSDHRQGDIQFVWRGHISGSAEGEIRFDFDGEALTAFKRNRIGFCVLHPMEVAGLACEVVHTDGAAEKTTFPLHISSHQPVYDIRALRHEVLPGLVAEVRMEGDTFEMEDQRNWTDASFKTYCTPLGLPFPAEVKAGDRVQQAVVIRLIGRAPSVAVEAPPLTLAASDGPAVPVPPIGIGWKAGTALSARERDQLAALRPAHLRVEVYPETALETLAEAANAAHALDTLLEVALHLGEDVEAGLRRVAAAADAERPPVARWLVFRKGELSTRRETVQAARAALERFGAPIGAGTDAFFTELNRERPTADLLDWVAYSLNPQVHAFDNASLVETLAAQAATVASARQFSGKARIAVTPVSLKMRWNPNATSAEPPTPAGTLPRQVDVRQMSLFGAAWTLGSLKSLILAGADSLTYYEALGWLGVIERDAGSPLPELFPSVAGGVHPLYHPLADVLQFGGEALPAASSSPLTADGLALRKDGRLRLLLANFTAEPQTLLVTGVRGEFAVRALDETTAHAALRSPEAFRAEPGSLHTARADGLRVTLLPYSTLCCDQTH